MIKGKLKSIQQFLEDGARFDKNGNLILKNGTEIDSTDLIVLGTIQENIEFDCAEENDNLFKITTEDDNGHYFYQSEFEYLEGFDEPKKPDFDTDDLRAYKHDDGNVVFVVANSSAEKSYLGNGWTDVSKAF